jgi:chromate transporter
MSQAQSPSIQEAFWFWLKLGFISFGGPAGQISTMHEELVEKKKWISEENFLHALNYCMLLPGPEAQQLATYLGWLMHRTWGGIMAGVLFILPSLLLFIGLSWMYLEYGQQNWLVTVFDTLKPAVLAIIFYAAYKMGKKTIRSFLLAGVTLSSVMAITVLNVSFPWVVLVAAIVGCVFGQLQRQTKDEVTQPESLTSELASKAFHLKRILKTLGVFLLLWTAPIVIFISLHGWQHTYTQMSWFFTKAAFLTFGGAYAVLPYVYEATVEHFQWLSSAQILDGLALGESTPGPLIMIVAFVGFLASYQQALMGNSYLFEAGALGALTATWFTFLPSFMFILLGAPLIEKTKQFPKMVQALQFITAAVVGTILQLGLFFAQHIYWPNGFHQEISIFALGMSFISAYLLIFRNWSIIQLLGLCLIVASFRLLLF